MSFTVKIVDNDTGNVLCDENNANCVVGVIGQQNGTKSVRFLKCNPITLYHAVGAIQEGLAEIDKEFPELALIAQLKAVADKRKAEGKS